MYQAYAAYYDHSGQDRFAALFALYAQELLRRHAVPGQRVLDIACGTGTLAILLAEQGWQVHGVDNSAAMLAQARAKSGDEQHVQFSQLDMRDAAGIAALGRFDLALCCYDTLNYMLDPADLAACFRAAAAALRPGGLYLADMNTPYFIRELWGQFDVRELPGYTQVEQSHIDAEACIATMVVSGFVGDDRRGYRRFDEVHRERGYPAEQIAELLTAAGFAIEACYADFTHDPPTPTSSRLFWLARRLA